jgi:hypothetical protein
MRSVEEDTFVATCGEIALHDWNAATGKSWAVPGSADEFQASFKRRCKRLLDSG